jgi:hypothetical protein
MFKVRTVQDPYIVLQDAQILTGKAGGTHSYHWDKEFLFMFMSMV